MVSYVAVNSKVMHGITRLGQTVVSKWGTENVIISLSYLSGAHPSFVVKPKKLGSNILACGGAAY